MFIDSTGSAIIHSGTVTREPDASFEHHSRAGMGIKYPNVVVEIGTSESLRSLHEIAQEYMSWPEIGIFNTHPRVSDGDYCEDV